MYNHIEELVETIKQSSEYILYKENEKLLYKSETKYLLQKYQDTLQNYNELKKYSQYISTSDLENEIKALKIKMSKDDNINEYYQSYYRLNDLLEEVTKIVFKGIDDSLVQSRWKL